MYLIEGKPKKPNQANIDSICEIIYSTIRPLHTNTATKLPATTIGFVPHFHTPETTTVYPDYPAYQFIQ